MPDNKKPELNPVDEPNKVDVVKTPVQKLGKPFEGSYLKKTIDMKFKKSF